MYFIIITGQNNRIPRGIPHILCQVYNRATPIPSGRLPIPEQASQAYRSRAGTLTDPTPSGHDPLESDSMKKHLWMQAFHSRYSSFDTIFHELVNGKNELFSEALPFYIDISRPMSCTYKSIAHAQSIVM